jgi:hypothetical protein
LRRLDIMKTWHLPLTIVVVATTPAVAAGIFNGTGNSGEYVVTPATPPGDGTAAKDAPVESYWDLPLWVQIASTVDSLLILGWLVSFFPPAASSTCWTTATGSASSATSRIIPAAPRPRSRRSRT